MVVLATVTWLGMELKNRNVELLGIQKELENRNVILVGIQDELKKKNEDILEVQKQIQTSLETGLELMLELIPALVPLDTTSASQASVAPSMEKLQIKLQAYINHLAELNLDDAEQMVQRLLEAINQRFSDYNILKSINTHYFLEIETTVRDVPIVIIPLSGTERLTEENVRDKFSKKPGTGGDSDISEAGTLPAMNDHVNE